MNNLYTILESNVISIMGVEETTDFLHDNCLDDDKNHIFNLLKLSDNNHYEWQYFIFKTKDLKNTCVYLLTNSFKKDDRIVGIIYSHDVNDLLLLFTHMSKAFILNIHLGPENLFKGNFYDAIYTSLLTTKDRTTLLLNN